VTRTIKKAVASHLLDFMMSEMQMMPLMLWMERLWTAGSCAYSTLGTVAQERNAERSVEMIAEMIAVVLRRIQHPGADDTVAADLAQGATLDHIDEDDHHEATHAIVIDTVPIERGVYLRVLVEGMVALL